MFKMNKARRLLLRALPLFLAPLIFQGYAAFAHRRGEGAQEDGRQQKTGSPGVAIKSQVTNLKDVAKQEMTLPPVYNEYEEVHEHPPSPGDRSVPEGVKIVNVRPDAYASNNRSLTPSPSPSASFQALDDNNNLIPPDTHGAVGPNHLMVTLNTQVRIQNRSGGNIVTVPLGGFWGRSGTFDPKVLYDPYSNRWIFTTCVDAKKATSGILIGVTQTSDPTGNWNIYRIDADEDDLVWADYPSIGFNKDWIVVQLNMFDIASPGGFNRSHIYVLNKADFYAGVKGRFTLFQDEGFSQTPAITYDSAISTIYLVETWNSASGILRLSTINGAVGSEILTTGVAFPGTAPWVGSPGEGDFAPQLGSTMRIQNNDSRMQNTVYRNGSLWCTHTIFLPAGNSPTRSAVQWWELNLSGAVRQIGRIDDPAGKIFYAFPSIAVNKNNDVLVGYSRFSAAQYASANYSFRSAADPSGTLRDDTALKAGEAPYFKTLSGTKNRWGDYSNTQVDPVNDVDLWTIQEYAAIPLGGIDRWGTWWGRLSPATFSGPDLAVSKSHSGNFAVGINGVYNIRVTNVGTANTSGAVTMTDALPAGLSFVSGNGIGWNCLATGQNVTCTNNNVLAPGSSSAITLTVGVTEAAIPAVINTANVLNTGDANPSNNIASDPTIVIGGTADLAITLSASPNSVSSNANLTYTLKITNGGSGVASFVKVTDNLSSAVSFASCTATSNGVCSGSGNNRIVTFASLAPNASATITLVTLPNCSTAVNASITNTATVTSTTPDPNGANNSATVTIAVAPPQAKLILEGDKSAFDFGSIPAVREPNPTLPSSAFSIENTGCGILPVAFSLKRTGVDINNGKIINSDDGVTFPIKIINAGGSETPVSSAQVLGGDKRGFRLYFNPLIPAPAGKTSGLFANQVLPDLINSMLTITTNGGGAFNFPITAHLATGAKLINPLAPRLAPLVALAKSGNEFAVELSAYDANLDIYYVTYQFLDASGRPVGDPPGFDLAQPIGQSGMLKGQSFTLVKRFTGAMALPQVNKVRVTLYDREGNEAVLSGEIGKVIGRVVNVSAASFLEAGLASGAITSAFGTNLAASTQAATSSQLPTSLAGTRVFVRDSANVERLAPLFFIAPSQINYQIPTGTSAGLATVTVALNDQVVATATAQIAMAAPSLFAANANGQGVASAVALRVKANGSQSYEPVSVFDQAQNKFVSRPISLGASNEQVYLVLFGTGIRNRSALSNVKVKIGGVDVSVEYAGPQGGFVGLDQVNLRLPRSLAGRGEVDVVLTVDGKQSNVVKINVY